VNNKDLEGDRATYEGTACEIWNTLRMFKNEVLRRIGRRKLRQDGEMCIMRNLMVCYIHQVLLK
jgi:hypothetical protein